MSLTEHIKVDERSEIGLLDLFLYRGQFPDASKRDIEKEGARFLLDQLHPGASEHLYYDEHGKPHLTNLNKYISVSHSHNRLAIITNTVEHTGIDIELIRDKVLAIRHKFLSAEELDAIPSGQVEKSLVYWAAKESLYKIHGRKKVDFTRDLFIAPFDYQQDGGEIKGRISLPDYNKIFNLHYQKKEEYILVYMLNESKGNL